VADRARAKVAALLAAAATAAAAQPPAPPEGHTALTLTPTPARDVAVAELLTLPPSWLSAPPVADDVPEAHRVRFEPVTLALRAHDGRAWFATTSAAAYAALRAAGQPVLTGSELGALAVAAEQDRASRPWLAGWLERLADGATMRLDVATALGGVEGEETPNQRWSLARVLRAFGCGLACVLTDDLTTNTTNPDQWIQHALKGD
jgi:hypothetical protein